MNARLDGIVFAGSNLKGAYLDGASLAEANLIEANFAEASLCGATISPGACGGVDFFRANLEEANLESTQCRDSCLVQADLSRAKIVLTGFDNALFSFTKLHDAFMGVRPPLGEIQYAKHPQRSYEMPNDVDESALRRRPRMWFGLSAHDLATKREP